MQSSKNDIKNESHFNLCLPTSVLLTLFQRILDCLFYPLTPITTLYLCDNRVIQKSSAVNLQCSRVIPRKWFMRTRHKGETLPATRLIWVLLKRPWWYFSLATLFRLISWSLMMAEWSSSLVINKAMFSLWSGDCCLCLRRNCWGAYTCFCRTFYVLEQGNIVGNANVSGSRSEMSK